MNAKTNLTHPNKRLECRFKRTIDPENKGEKLHFANQYSNGQLLLLHEQAIQNNLKTPMHPYFKQKTGIEGYNKTKFESW